MVFFYKPVLLEFGWTRAQTAIAFSLAMGLTALGALITTLLKPAGTILGEAAQ